MPIVYRLVKGSPLTFAEEDGNFAELAGRTDLAWAMIGADPIIREGTGSAPQLSLFRGGIYEYEYANGQTNESYLNFDVPFDYAPGTDLVVGVHWSPGSSTATGTVRFGLEFTYAWTYAPGTNTTFGATQTVYINASQADGTAYAHYVNFNDPANNFPGSMVQQNMRFLVRFFRDGSNVADTFPASIYVVGVDFFYQTNRFGTATKVPPFA